MFKIPSPEKKFAVDNASMTRGNVYSTYNIMFDADKGRIKVNPPLTYYLRQTYSSGASFNTPSAIVIAQQNGGGANDAYILMGKNGYGGVWSSNLSASIATSPYVYATNSDMCLFLKNSTYYLHVSGSGGIYYVDPSSSEGAWSMYSFPSAITLGKIIVPFLDTNRLYITNGTLITSMNSTGTILNPTGAGSYMQVGGLDNITCMRASSKRIWYANSATNGDGNAKIYEWDGVNSNPLSIHIISTPYILAMTILNDLPVAIDGRGRFWFYDGNTFITKEEIQIPSREDDFSDQTIRVHRNGMITEKGKIYVLVGSYSSTKNTTERALSGIWCYDPEIGLYHFSSPDGISQIPTPLALSRGQSDKVFIASYLAGTATIATSSVISKTETTSGVAGSTRTGFITTQFLEANGLNNMFNLINVRYRKMIANAAQIEVKYRTWKNVECNSLITWTGATTFTATANNLGGTTTFSTPVAVGDEIMVQNGANAGLIAQITNIVEAGGVDTVTIDRSATATSGTSYASFSNFTLLKTIYKDGMTFKNIRLGVPATMLQVKLVMSWKGYFDEVQEISIPEQEHETI